KSAALDQRGGISLHSNKREAAPHRYGVTQNYLRTAPSSAYKSGSEKRDVKSDVAFKDDRPASRSPVSAKASNTGRWVPLNVVRDVQDRNEAIFRKVRGILNKLTPEKFDRLIFELLNLGLTSKTILKGIILLIFEKALEEPKYSSLYAQLCLRLSHDAPNFDDSSSSNTTSFRRLLLSKCQEEFESRADASAVFDKQEGLLTTEQQEEKALSKRKMLGNIKFIGELGKLGMLHEAILHKCIQQLLAKKKKANFVDMSEDIECLCQIMTTVGKRLDVPKAENIMNQYFDRMKMLADSPELPSRIRFMLQDTLDLRNHAWISRRVKTSEAGPVPVSKLRWEAYATSPGQPPHNFMHLPFPPPMPFGMPPPQALFGQPGHPMAPMMPPGMFPPGGLGPRMADLTLVQDAQKDIFGKDPVPKNQQVMKKIKEKREDLFEPHYLKNKPTSSALSTPATLAAQHLAPKQIKSYATASLPTNLPQMQQTPPKKYDFFDNDGFNDILQPTAPKSSPWSIDPFPKTSSATPVTSSTGFVDGNFNQVSQQNQANKVVNGQSDNKTFPFTRSTMQKAGNISLRPTTSLATPKKEEETKLDKSPSKTSTNAVNLVIKDKQEKSKTKKNLLSKPEYERRVELTLKQNGTNGNVDNAVQALKLITNAQSYSKMLANKVMKESLARDTEYWNFIGKLLVELQKNDVISTDVLQNALIATADFVKTNRVENGVDYFSTIGTLIVEEEVLSLVELRDFFINGELFPGFFKALHKLAADKGEKWLSEKVEEYKIDVMSTLPVDMQTESDLLKFARESNVGFLFPVLCIQAQLSEVLNTQSDVGEIQSWIKENMENAMADKKMFIQSLLLCILKHVLADCTLTAGVDTNHIPEKDLQEKEKESIKKFSPLIKSFLDEHSKLQIEAVYGLQQFCFLNNFPKGMLLRLFMAFYDLEMIEEDAFLRWREDINDEYPGKGKALFQVNNWLQWLETADEEDESDEEQA
ncbi:eukaryotic translation initiation factor 4 gamma 2-like, partial [Rhopilema esculentum]|uniref:eukaryotic translation initiation factor 4 gamma 2-like n=1 Tax=Rhopilema esculentum TaxID=499914 RepID=UPI0031D204DA